MDKEEMLKKAIEKAAKNGCKDLPFGITWADYDEYFELEEWSKTVIFSHDFAKAVSGVLLAQKSPQLFNNIL